jgi:hypothetical protein
LAWLALHMLLASLAEQKAVNRTYLVFASEQHSNSSNIPCSAAYIQPVHCVIFVTPHHSSSSSENLTPSLLVQKNTTLIRISPRKYSTTPAQIHLLRCCMLKRTPCCGILQQTHSSCSQLHSTFLACQLSTSLLNS